MFRSLFDKLRRLRQMVALLSDRPSKRGDLRPRLALTLLEDRSLPTPVVTIEWIADTQEGGSTPGRVRLTRSETTGSLSAIRGSRISPVKCVTFTSQAWTPLVYPRLATRPFRELAPKPREVKQ